MHWGCALEASYTGAVKLFYKLKRPLSRLGSVHKYIQKCRNSRRVFLVHVSEKVAAFSIVMVFVVVFL